MTVLLQEMETLLAAFELCLMRVLRFGVVILKIFFFFFLRVIYLFICEREVGGRAAEGKGEKVLSRFYAERGA